MSRLLHFRNRVTVFAPTDAAFAVLDDALSGYLLSKNGTEDLTYASARFAPRCIILSSCP